MCLLLRCDRPTEQSFLKVKIRMSREIMHKGHKEEKHPANVVGSADGGEL
jgi:hypothetical protein